MTITDSRAVRAAEHAARARGIQVDRVEVLADGFNLLVALGPGGTVVCRIATVTAQVRADPALRMLNELQIAQYLADQGFPSVRPLQDVPLEVMTIGGFHITLWERLKITNDAQPDPASIGASLRDLHATLRGCPVSLDGAAPAGDVARMLQSLSTVEFLATDVYKELLDESEQVTALAELFDTNQVQHGDAHPGNCALVGGLITWFDFEETCQAPVWWDLAALRDTWRLDGAAAVRGYGIDSDDDRLRRWRLLRNHEWVLWNLVAACHFPDAVQDVPDAIERWRKVKAALSQPG